MSEQREDDEQAGGGSGGASDEQSGDPGRTPGKAEGDEQTVDESLRQKG